MYIITGGGSGIGKALAISLAQREQSVLIVGRREELLIDTAKSSPLISFLCADVSTEEGRELVREYCNNLPYIDALINNAGSVEPIISIHDIKVEQWHQTLSTNLDAALFLPQKLRDKLINGRVLNIGSGAAYFPIKGWVAYCVSKAALSMLTQCYQLESKTIAFASVMPGIVDTDMQVLARNAKSMEEDQINFYQKLKDDNRLISTETVSHFLTWLLMDIDRDTFKSKEWDIYDTSHHQAWIKDTDQVLYWDY